MAGIILKNAVVEINGTTALGGLTRKVDLSYEFDEHETTPFSTSTGPVGKTSIAGLGSWSASVDVLQDFNSGNVDATLWSLIGGSDFDVRIAVSSTGTSVSTPQYTGHCLLTKYSPISGNVGDLVTVSVELKGCGILQRNTVSCSGW